MIIQADSLAPFPLPDASVQCCITSPPYWGLRDYGVDGQLGLEPTPEEYVERLVGVFREVWRVLRDDGTIWLNLGDCYANDGKWGGETGGKQAYLDDANRKRVGREKRVTGLKPKDLVMMPARVALALQADGWWLRSDIIWHKPNPMPESVTDRPTKAHEYLFLLAKSGRDLYWVHRDRPYPEGNHSWPVPDYRWWDSVAGAELREVPAGSSLVTYIDADGKERSRYRRYNLWRGCDYYYDAEAIKEPGQDWGTRDRKPGSAFVDGTPGRSKQSGGKNCDFSSGRNRRTVWTIPTQPTPEAHFAAFPEALVEPCVLAGSATGDLVLDPFGGTGTTVKVAQQLGRKAVALEISAEYCRMAHDKTWQSSRQIQLA